MADDNVVEFKKKEKQELVWECPCGCQLFWLEDNGARCHKCNMLMSYFNLAGTFFEELDNDEDE
jgi:hypothetical protein